MRALLLVGLAVALAAPASAQRYGARSNTEGLFLQVGVQGQGLELEVPGDDLEAEGGGAAVRAGYGFSPLFTLYGGVSGGRVEFDRSGDDALLGAAEVGARFSFNRRGAVRPYLDVALRGVTLEDEDAEVEYRGGALGLGGGVAYFLSPTVAVDAALHLGGGQFDDVSYGRATLDLRQGEVDFGEGRLMVGLTAYPFAKTHGRRGPRGRGGRRGGRH